MDEKNKNEMILKSNPDEILLRDTELSNKENLFFEEKSDDKPTKKVNSLGTVLSIGNSMIGSSIVTLPYNVYQTGIIPAIVLNIIYGLISFYTCKIYVYLSSINSDFSLTIEKYFNKVFGKRISKNRKNYPNIFLYFYGCGRFHYLFHNNVPKFLSRDMPYIK